MPAAPIIYKKLAPVLVALIKTRIDARSEIPPLLEQLRAACGAAIAGEALVIFHGGAVKEGFLIEAAYPMTRPVETDIIHTRTLEAAPALTMLHHGPHQSIRETVLKVYSITVQHLP